MNEFAMGVGYLLIAFSSIIGLIGIFWVAGEIIYRTKKRGMNWLDVADALDQWKKNNPEKFKRWEKRNGA